MRKILVALMMTAGVALADPTPKPADAPTTTTPTPVVGKWGQHYLNRVEKFRAENKALQPGDKYLVFVGDSLTEGLKLESLLPGEKTLNRGIISDGLRGADPAVPGLPGRLRESVFDCQPRAVFLLIGTNDIPHTEKPLEFYEKKYEALVDEILKGAPGVPLIIHTLPPTGEKYKRHAEFNPRAAEFNVFLRSLAKRKALALIDLEPLLRGPDQLLRPELTGDGLHLTASGQALWGTELKQAISALPKPAPAK